MNEALRPLVGQRVKIEADGVGKVEATLESFDAPWVRVRTNKERVLCLPFARIFYIEAA